MTAKIVSVKIKTDSVKTGLSREFMNDIFQFTKKTILLVNKFTIQAKGSKLQNMVKKHRIIWHGNFSK